MKRRNETKEVTKEVTKDVTEAAAVVKRSPSVSVSASGSDSGSDSDSGSESGSGGSSLIMDQKEKILLLPLLLIPEKSEKFRLYKAGSEIFRLCRPARPGACGKPVDKKSEKFRLFKAGIHAASVTLRTNGLKLQPPISHYRGEIKRGLPLVGGNFW